MRTILCPIDFSAVSLNALSYAANLARHMKGHLILAHLINISATKLNPRSLKPVNKDEQETCEDKLRKLAQELERDFELKGKIEIICQYGYFPSSLNELIKPEAIDFVVMGTNGAVRFLKKMMGTNTFEFAKNATCPVLIIPPGVAFTGFKQVAYASDFISEEIKSLHQLNYFFEPFRETSVSIINILTERQSNIYCNNQVIREIVHHFEKSKFAIAQMQESDILAGLHDFVTDNQVDVLAISIHERNFLENLFHPNISKKLIYYTRLPILTLPPKPYQVSILKSEKVKQHLPW